MEMYIMARTLYTITLSSAERERLQNIVGDGTESTRTILRAKIVLMSDTSQATKYTVSELARVLGTTNTTVQATRTQYGKGGLEAAVFRKTRVLENGGYKFNNEIVAKILELADSTPPDGYKRWSVRRLCKACMEQGIVDSIAPSSMDEILRKAGISLKK
jgi:transposase